MNKKKINKVDQDEVPAPDSNLETIISNMKKLHGMTTQGRWMKGDTSHETVCQRKVGKPYKLADFRHADDASFVDYAHAHVPALLNEIARLRAEVLDLKKLTEFQARGHLIVWVEDGDWYQFLQKSHEEVPEYFIEELKNRQNRPGRGRLWISPKFRDVPLIGAINWKLDEPSTELLSVHFGGIVIEANDLYSVLSIPAIITDMNLNVVKDNRLTYKNNLLSVIL